MPSPQARHLEALRRWARLLDSAFRIPGTNVRFGFDVLIGLIPGLGDVSSPVFAAAVLLEAVRRRVPLVVQARMVLNAAIDMLLGLVPLLGDAVDVAWKANLRNLALLERHAHAGVPPEPADYAFVALCLIALALIALTPIVLLAWLISKWSLV